MQKLEKLIKFLSTDIEVDCRDVIVVIDDNHATELPNFTRTIS